MLLHVCVTLTNFVIFLMLLHVCVTYARVARSLLSQQSKGACLVQTHTHTLPGGAALPGSVGRSAIWERKQLVYQQANSRHRVLVLKVCAVKTKLFEYRLSDFI